MQISKNLKLNIMGESDDADINKVAENFQIIDQKAMEWSNFSNTGTVLDTENDFQIATVFPIPDEDSAIFTVTVKMPRAFAKSDTITVSGIAYNLYQGTNSAPDEAWKAGEVITIHFDKASRRCWASAGAAGTAEEMIDALTTTAASDDGVNYSATVSGITSLKIGTTVVIIPSITSTTNSPKLNLNSFGAKNIKQRLSETTSLTVQAASENWLVAAKPVVLQYDGTQWVTMFSRPSANDMYGEVPVKSGGTGASTAAQALVNLGVTSGTADLTAGASELGDGKFYFVYE